MHPKPHIAIINGPNLNLLGIRQPHIYGHESFGDFFETLVHDFSQAHFTHFQSNVEGEIIDELQRVGFEAFGILLNAAGYTHTSLAIADAVAAVTSPVIEVHVSNPYAREEHRHKSLIAPHCKGLVAGFGLNGYRLAVEALLNSGSGSRAGSR